MGKKPLQVYTKHTERQNLAVVLLRHLPRQTTANIDMPTDEYEARRNSRMGGEMHVWEDNTLSV